MSQLTNMYSGVDGRVAKQQYLRNYLKIFQALQPDVNPAEAEGEAEVAAFGV